MKPEAGEGRDVRYEAGRWEVRRDERFTSYRRSRLAYEAYLQVRCDFELGCEALELGLFATPAIYPAVPPGHALIRTSVTPAHTREHLQQALDILAVLAGRHAVTNLDPATVPPARSMDFDEVLAAQAAGVP